MSKSDSGYEVVIRPPKKGLIGIDFEELWRYRELAWVFALRDIKVRYKQTFIGVLWAVLQPVMTVILFNFVFGRLAKIPSEGIPYPLFSFMGVALWTYFSTSLSNASNSVVGNEGIIKKVYFPRLVLPISSALTPLADFLISLIIFAALMLYYGYAPSILGILLFPLLILISFLAATGIGLVCASLNLKYRDIRYALPFFIQIGMYATPVIYPSSLLEGRFHWILTLNPMTGVIEAARAGVLQTGSVDFKLLGISALIAVALFIFGMLRFKKTERLFADIV